MENSSKRKASDDSWPTIPTKEKKKRQWQTPSHKRAIQGVTIQPGDAGIWATCDKGRERKCIGELKDLFQEYAENLYEDATTDAQAVGDEDEEEAGDIDIESEINDEVQGMRKPQGKPLFTNVRVDVQCVMFFKTRAPVDPVALVHAICRDALQTGKKKTRHVKRMTPVTKIGKATEKGIADLAKEVLAPYFHTEDGTTRSFKIQPTTRNHDKTLSREIVIQTVASIVGGSHKVNLDKPELTILVEIYRSHCGMSVVGADFDELKRFNLAEIYSPSSSGKQEQKQTSQSPLPGAAQT